ncbi:anion permease [Desulfurococcaceae archaeon MEX13E-LK6-19]|nr:anion permease [Desulfurococcaceae archaeon MEX13E-LK6-19]
MILLLLYLGIILYKPLILVKTPWLIDYRSITMIMTLMLISRGLEFSGYITILAHRITTCCGGLEKLNILIIIFSMFIAAVLMNDTALFILMPLVLAIAKIIRIDPTKIIVLTVIAVNIGSALTPIGNPQNIIIWQYYDINVVDFMKYTFTVFLPAIVFLIIYTLAIMPKKEFKKPQTPPLIKRDPVLALLSLTLLILTVIAAEENYTLIALLIAIISYGIYRREIIKGLDYVLVMIFVMMFIDFRSIVFILNIVPSNIPSLLFIESVLLSQIVSNVPATIILLGCDWHILLLGVNVGGVGFIAGSLANFIALRLTGINIKDFHKITLPYFAVLVIFYYIMALLGFI